jgi:NitT/TauT family transport system ATP-binding protein
MDEALICVENLTVGYGPTPVLDNISFRVRRGEFVAVVGLSGSGKTTLLNALARFIPGEGEIEMRGKVGVVFQDHAAFPWMTVAGNISFGLEGKNRSDKKRIMKEFLQRIHMEEYANRYPAELSGGQVQRVGLARALAPNPEIVLMDEPYGALDRYTRERMQEWLLEVWSQDHKTVVFVTHDIEEAVFLADRILVIADGKVVQEVDVDFPRPRAEEVKFSSDFTALKKEVLQAMRFAQDNITTML